MKTIVSCFLTLCLNHIFDCAGENRCCLIRTRWPYDRVPILNFTAMIDLFIISWLLIEHAENLRKPG